MTFKVNQAWAMSVTSMLRWESRGFDPRSRGTFAAYRIM